MGDAQSKIRTIIYSIFALIVGIVLIRVLLKIVGANPNNEFADFWYTFSDIFVEPWAVIYPGIVSGRMVIEIYSIVAVLFYIIISIVASKSVSSPFEDTRKLAIIELVDSIFKAIEFLLITRFIFKITAASTSALFVRLIYDLSWIVYEPFATLMPAIEFEGARFEISTLVALVVIIILDLVTEQLLFSLLDGIFPERTKIVKKIVHQAAPLPPTYPAPQQTYPGQGPLAPAQPTNININMPPQYPQQHPGYVQSVPAQPMPVKKQVLKPQKRGFLSWPGKKRSSRAGGPANS